MGAGNSCRNHPAPKDRAPKATACPELRPDRKRLGSLDEFDKLIPSWRAPCSGQACLQGGDYFALGCAGRSLMRFWPSSRVCLCYGLLGGTFVTLASVSE